MTPKSSIRRFKLSPRIPHQRFPELGLCGEDYTNLGFPLPHSEPQGMCYVETANLDGETNLKIRQVKSLHDSCCYRRSGCKYMIQISPTHFVGKKLFGREQHYMVNPRGSSRSLCFRLGGKETQKSKILQLSRS